MMKQLAKPAALLIVVGFALPVMASGSDDPHYETAFLSPPAPGVTCHSDTSCQNAPSGPEIQAFHNDHDHVVTVWARDRATDQVDYWQCIEPGMYSGDRASDPSQGSIDGDWIHAPTSPYLGDMQWAGPGFQAAYDYEWYDDCWAPCEFPFIINCIFLTPFKEDQPEG